MPIYFMREGHLNWGGIKEDDVFTSKLPAGVNAYCVIKIQNAKVYENRYPQLKKLYEKNGFVLQTG